MAIKNIWRSISVTLIVKFFIAFLAMFGILKISTDYLLPKFFSSDADPSNVTSLSNPSDTFKAVRFHYSGGGALAPFCYDRVAIVRSTASDLDARNASFQVYRSDCGSFFDHQQSPKIEWQSQNQLRITASIHNSAHYPKIVAISSTDASKSIFIELIAHR